MIQELNFAYPTDQLCIWLALRLKFTDDAIKNEVIKYINGYTDYTKEIYGYQIYKIMKEKNFLSTSIIRNL